MRGPARRAEVKEGGGVAFFASSGSSAWHEKAEQEAVLGLFPGERGWRKPAGSRHRARFEEGGTGCSPSRPPSAQAGVGAVKPALNSDRCRGSPPAAQLLLAIEQPRGNAMPGVWSPPRQDCSGTRVGSDIVLLGQNPLVSRL